MDLGWLGAVSGEEVVRYFIGILLFAHQQHQWD